MKEPHNNYLPELLSPCGSPEALDAAIYAGADAVYLGTKILNARMNARNFDHESVTAAINRAHKSGVKVYVTMNTLVYDRAMKEAMDEAYFLCEAGADALIVADLGFASNLVRYLPDLPIHASTQVSGHNLDAAKYLAERGFSRMVCARELSKEDIAYLVKNSPVPIEMFIHGAMCVSASGQCLFSSLVGGRSGNRGECAQPCRMQYNGGKYPLSLKDMCLAGHITEIIDSGAASLKIEGRMKSPEYVYAVTSVYRRLLDERRNASEKEIEYLGRVFSRGGFTDGYYTSDMRNMNGVRSESDKKATEKLKISITRKRRDLPEIVIPERKTEELPDSFTGKEAAVGFVPGRSARWYKPGNMCGGDFFGINYIPLEAFGKFSANGVLMPPVIRDGEREDVARKLRAAYAGGARHALVGNVGHIELAKECGFIVHGDYRLNVFSNAAAKQYTDLADIMVSPELTLPQIRDINAKKSVMIYGRVPLMTLEKTCGASSLTDRTRAVFPVMKEAGRDIVLNSVPTYTADQKSKLKALGRFSEHFVFTVESKDEILKIIEAYKKGTPSESPVRRIK